MKVVVYHTNDFHSEFENLKKVHQYIRANKTAQDLYLDSGDYADISSVAVLADGGVSAMKLMVDSQVDAMTLGNNEIDLGKEGIKALAQCGIPLVSANIRDTQYQPIDGILSSMILTRANQRFLILGVAPYYSNTFEHESYNTFFLMGDIRTVEPIKLLKQALAEQAGKYDYCILLSHSGLIVDQRILAEVPEIQLCLGGHSHDIATKKGYSQSGRGERLGKVTLEITDSGIVEVENTQIDLAEVANERFDELYEEVKETTDKIMSKPLPCIRELTFDALDESELINFICDGLMQEGESDLAIMHAGIAERNLTNPVSQKSLLETFPSKLNPTYYKIRGKAIREAIYLSLDSEHVKQAGRGAGFRGHILGTLGFSRNVQVVKGTGEITIDNQPLADEKIYNLVTDDYLQRGVGYPSLRVEDSQATFAPGFIRDIAEKNLMNVALYEQAKIKRVI